MRQEAGDHIGSWEKSIGKMQQGNILSVALLFYFRLQKPTLLDEVGPRDEVSFSKGNPRTNNAHRCRLCYVRLFQLVGVSVYPHQTVMKNLDSKPPLR